MKAAIIALICIFFTNGIYAQAYSDSALSKLNKIPVFKSLSADSNVTNIQKLMRKGQPNIVLFFSPDCDHCQEEITKIKENMDSLKHINFILITNRPPSLIKKFVQEYKIGKFKNFNYLCDVGNNLTRFYGISSNPSMFFYNKELTCIAGYNSSMVPVKIIQSKASL